MLKTSNHVYAIPFILISHDYDTEYNWSIYNRNHGSPSPYSTK